jgi:4-alpha-glucanotransferase
VAAALAAMGASDAGPPPPATWVVQQRHGLQVPFEAVLEYEDGGSVAVSGNVSPAELPLGYHRVVRPDGEPIGLIVSPGRCPLPSRTWGWAAQLYATRSRDSWGLGDFADLARLAAWSGEELGAGLLLVNPVHAVAPAAAQQPSPYFPASRVWRNPLYLRIEDVPGFDGTLDDLAKAGRALNSDRRIDRARVWALKREALARLWSRRRDPTFDRWRAEQGGLLEGFATWAALVDEHGEDWRSWPAGLRDPGSPEVAAFAAAHPDAVAFHAWLQWLCATQLAGAAGAGAPLVLDVAIGTDPAGADAWLWQDVLARDVTVGAPPDEFAPSGQDWGLPPFDPWRLRSAGYEPFVRTVRASMERGGGVRIDHVAGLFRLFWVPSGRSPAAGVYVRYPWEDLLNVLALEAHRAGAFVVGEDLGTIEPSVREALMAWGVLSYRLVWFEERPPAEWPEPALGAVTTHDLPTVRGAWTGADLAARQAVGLDVDEEAEAALRHRLVAGESVGEVVLGTYEALAAGPCLLVTATLEDVLEVEERPNMPGTVDQWPNWSLALPEPLDAVMEDPRMAALAQVMARHGRRSG